ncbi:hypothetical protein BGZ65_001671, partial [Modicella reniformis]
MSDYNSRYLVPTFNGLMAQIGLSTGIIAICVGFFEWNRRKKTLQYLYAPRCTLNVNPSPPMSSKFLGWIIPTIKIPEEFYVDNVGLDAVMFLRFIRMCFHFCLFNGLVVGIILLPIHYSGGGNEVEVPRMSIANVKNNSDTLWAHVMLTYLVTVSWMFLLFKNYWQWMDLRREYTLERIREGEIAERSVFISRLPSHLRTDSALQQYFESLKMGPVEKATVVKHCGRLSQKIDRRESVLNKLEKAHIDLAQATLDAAKHGRISLNPPDMSRTHLEPIKEEENEDEEGAPAAVAATGKSGGDPKALEKMVQELYRDKKRYYKTRKSVFARNKKASVDTSNPLQLNIPLSALSQHSDLIDVYVHGKEGDEQQQQQQQQQQQVDDPNIWNVLAGMDRSTLDEFKPTRPTKRFKRGERVESIDYLVKKYNRLDRH